MAPGTLASAVAATAYYFLQPLQQNAILVLASIILMIAGTAAAEVVESASKAHDPPYVVVDEVLGQCIALVSPLFHGDLLYLLLSFILFRLFDITKPFPASWFQQKRGGLHVMMDDVVAGAYANLSAHLGMWAVSLVG
jgi:phosphatidylglycerophosphatase A